MPRTVDLDGGHVDKVGWIQSTEPTGPLVQPGRCWIDISRVPYRMYIRGSSSWNLVGTVESDPEVTLKYEKDGTTVKELISIDGGSTWKLLRTIDLS